MAKQKLSISNSCDSTNSNSFVSSSFSSISSNDRLRNISNESNSNSNSSSSNYYSADESECRKREGQQQQHRIPATNQNTAPKYISVCSVCQQFITESDLIKSSNITPYPKKIHGHCWLHITTKDCPIPWPRNLPRIVKEPKSEQLPTIRKIQKLYSFMASGISAVSKY